MADTQWPRYMVFQKMTKDQAWQHNGTVHAPDAELALLNARDVFSRRPDAVGMFVVPDSAIYRVTREQLERPEELPNSAQFAEEKEIMVFIKAFEQSPCEHVGSVKAKSALDALEKAQQQYVPQGVLWWWFFPVEAKYGSEEDEADALFGAARRKTYKDSSEYHTVTMMRQLRSKGRLEEE